MVQNFIAQSENIESMLVATLGAEEFNKEISRILSEYADMIDRRAAIYILGIEKGVVQKRRKQIESFQELEEGLSGITFRAVVQRVFVPFESKMHRTLRALISDEKGGEKVIVLWDERVDDALSNRIEEGDTLIVENAYYRNGELQAGQYSAVKIDKKDKVMPLSKVSDGKCNVMVRLVSPLVVRTYTRDNQERKMATGFVADDTGRVRFVAWNGAVATVEGAKAGDVLRIRSALFKNGELHINEFSQVDLNPEGQIVLNRVEEVFEGVPCAYSCTVISALESNGRLYIVSRTEEKDIKVLVQEDAVRQFIGSLSPDIEIATAGLLKLKSLVGKECILEGKMNGNGIFECTRMIEA